ncbi:ZIP family metal transporter [Natrinema gelatinilyticum]|uniref:ZIP family metal transporter n=1 Tax=Natrinema gelatinilyticum TaxID=2961571 RepID=UPI0020C2D583|nr:metal transporter [Natrinema gelatinilyticum]
MTTDPKSDGGVTQSPNRPFGLPRWVIGVVPILLLGLVVGGFVATTPLAGVDGGEPLPDVSIDYTTLPNDDTIRLHVTNNAPEPVTISQVHVDDANWQFEMTGAGGDRTLEPLESATIEIPYSWMEEYDYSVTVIADNGATFSTTIVAANSSPGLTGQVVWTLTVIGFLIGIVPIALGIMWFPFMQTMSKKWLNAMLAFSAGVLGYLIFDGGFEAFETAQSVPSGYSGPLLVVLGISGAWLLLQAVMDWLTDDEGESRLSLAYSAALGIGLHNLAEGLAIGAAFATGRTSLGMFLIIGFMIHNVTEGPVIIAPLADGNRPSLVHFVAFGLLAGAPAILGGWIGVSTQSPLLNTLFLAIGVGALLQVVFDIGDIVRRTGSIRSAPNMMGFAIGLVFMYATGLFTL